MKAIRDALVLLRPKYFLVACVFFLSGYALGRPATTWRGLLADFAVLFFGGVVGVSGGALQFNSAFDRDEGPICMVDAPPPPPIGLAWIGLVMKLGGCAILALRGPVPGLAGLALTIMSVLYSMPLGMFPRFKEIPLLDIAWNGLGYGIFFTVIGVSVTGAPITSDVLAIGVGFFVAVMGSTLVAQIYQVGRTDYEDRNATAALGPRRSLEVAAVTYIVGATLAVLPRLVALALGAAPAVADVFFALFVFAYVAVGAYVLNWSRDPFDRPHVRMKRLTVLAPARGLFVVGAWLLAASAS